MPLKIVFCGTPSFALPTLRHLIAERDFKLAGVITQPDRPRGRGQELSSSPVKDAALEAGISVYQPEKIKSESAHDYFKRVAPEVVVIIAYGQIIPASLLEIPRLGWINLHESLLPKYRGAAPINWAIVNGEKRTGLTTMRIDAGLDTGPILMTHETTIGADETAPELTARLADAGAPLMVETLRKLERGEMTPTPQDNSRATPARPLKKEDGRMDFARSARDLFNRLHGFQPWPGAFTIFKGKTLQVHRAQTVHTGSKLTPGEIVVEGTHLLVGCGKDKDPDAEGALELIELQLEGKRRMSAQEFINGYRPKSGDHLGQ